MVHVGRYHEITVVGVQYRGGTQITKMTSPTCIMISPHGTHDIPHSTEHTFNMESV